MMAELAVVLPPMLATFFGLAQVTKLETTKLLVMHAAVCGARTAAVTSNVHGNNPGTPRGENDLPRRAVREALLPFIEAGTLSEPEVSVDDASSTADPSGPVRVTVTTKVRCSVPMMGRVVCKGPEKVFRAVAELPHQGATYADEREE